MSNLGCGFQKAPTTLDDEQYKPVIYSNIIWEDWSEAENLQKTKCVTVELSCVS